MGAPTRPKESPDFPYDPGGTLAGTDAACPPIEGGEGTARHDGGIFTSSAGVGAPGSGRSEANPPGEAEYHSLEDISVAQSVSDWITNNSVPDSIHQMGTLVYGDRLTSEGGCWKEHGMELTEVTDFCRRAKAIMTEPVASGVFSDSDLDMSLVERDTAAVRSLGLAQVIDDCAAKLKFRGWSEEELEANMGDYHLANNVMHLKRHGQQSYMKDGFISNGGVGYKQSKSYKEFTALCNKHIFKLQREGDAIIVEKSSLSKEELKATHFNTLQLAPSSNPNREGRCCINLSYKTRRPG
jgi:hypothetical protein